jgi:hypothetical protein
MEAFTVGEHNIQFKVGKIINLVSYDGGTR